MLPISKAVIQKEVNLFLTVVLDLLLKAFKKSLIAIKKLIIFKPNEKHDFGFKNFKAGSFLMIILYSFKNRYKKCKTQKLTALKLHFVHITTSPSSHATIPGDSFPSNRTAIRWKWLLIALCCAHDYENYFEFINICVM